MVGVVHWRGKKTLRGVSCVPVASGTVGVCYFLATTKTDFAEGRALAGPAMKINARVRALGRALE